MIFNIFLFKYHTKVVESVKDCDIKEWPSYKHISKFNIHISTLRPGPYTDLSWGWQHFDVSQSLIFMMS